MSGSHDVEVGGVVVAVSADAVFDHVVARVVLVGVVAEGHIAEPVGAEVEFAVVGELAEPVGGGGGGRVGW